MFWAKYPDSMGIWKIHLAVLGLVPVFLIRTLDINSHIVLPTLLVPP